MSRKSEALSIICSESASSIKANFKNAEIDFLRSYECGEVLLWFGEATGGHGAPGVGVIPELLVEEELPLLLVELLLDPGVEVEDPEFDVEPGVVLFADPGKVPHGLELDEPFGVLALGVAVG